MAETMTAAAAKVAYVKSQGQTRDHHCHWPGCTRQVPPALWGCKPHWHTLPEALRDRIWRTFKPGQEVAGTPSAAYIEAARDAQDWIRQHMADDPQRQLGDDQPQAPAPTPMGNIVTLIDGRQVDSWSEDWRHECEARHVANLPTLQTRREYLAAVFTKRNAAAGKALEDLVTQIYVAERADRLKTGEA